MIIGISLIWVAFFTINEFPKLLDRKPFNCIVCLSFWSVLIAFLLSEYIPMLKPIFNGLGAAGIAAYVSMMAKRLLFKI